MKLSKLKASLSAAAVTLISYSPLWAQTVVCDNPLDTSCGGGGGGGNDNGVIGGGVNPHWSHCSI